MEVKEIISELESNLQSLHSEFSSNSVFTNSLAQLTKLKQLLEHTSQKTLENNAPKESKVSQRDDEEHKSKMLTVGIIGGISYTSSQQYYQKLNEKVNEKYGGLTSAKIILNSLNLAEYANFAFTNRYDDLKKLILRAAEAIQPHIDFLVLCSNTSHMSYPLLRTHLTIPILHIADCYAHSIRQHGYERIGFIGTQFAMSGTFIHDRLKMHLHHPSLSKPFHVVSPSSPSVLHELQDIINALSIGDFGDIWKRRLLDVIETFRVEERLDSLILGCTELPLIVSQADFPQLAIIDSSLCHIEAAFLVLSCQLQISDFVPPPSADDDDDDDDGRC